MKTRQLLTLAASLACAGFLLPNSTFAGEAEDVLINEVDSDTPSFDTLEFVELYDGGSGNTPLDGLILVFFAGSDDASYLAFDLDGYTTNAQGFFVAGNPNVVNVDLVIPPGSQGAIGNGADAVALFFANAVDFPNDTPVTFNGMLDVLIYDTNDPDDTGLLTGLTPTNNLTVFQVNENENGDKDNHSNSRVPDGGLAFDASLWVAQTPTPGTSNAPELEISIELSLNPISESGGTTVATITLDAPASGDLPVTISVADPTEAEAVTTVITIPDTQISGTVTINAVDDLWPDGDQSVLITASAPGFLDGIAFLTVEDDGDAGIGLVLNEVLATGNSGDANGDGTTPSFDDQFIELVYNGGVSDPATLDISGYTVSDSDGVVYTFPAGTEIPKGCALVVFGGGDLLEGRPTLFSGAIVKLASNGLFLGDDDLVSIRNTSNQEVAGYAWGTLDPNNGSFVRDPDLTGAFSNHALLGGFFSPGTLTNASPFCPAESLSVSIDTPTVAEDAGTGAATVTVTRTGDTSSALTVFLASSDTTEAAVPVSVEIPATQTSATASLDAIDDTAADRTISVTISAMTSTLDVYTNGSATVDVTDDGDAVIDIFINEVDYHPDDTSTNDLEFVELYDGGIGNVSLDGHVLVFYNGNDPADAEYRIIDLDGEMTDGSGFFVVSTPSNGIQNGGDGGDGMALYRGATAAAFDDSAAGSPPFGAILVDSLVYEVGDGGLAASLGYTGPDLTDTGATGAFIGISRLPDGTGVFQLAPLTRGFSNGTPPSSGYSTWATGFTGIGDPDDDDDNDGLDNLAEYALGKNPLISDPTPGLLPSVNGGGNLQVNIGKGVDAGADPQLTYEVEASTDLISWSTADTVVVDDDNTEIVVEYTGASTVVFMRLRVSYP